MRRREGRLTSLDVDAIALAVVEAFDMDRLYSSKECNSRREALELMNERKESDLLHFVTAADYETRFDNVRIDHKANEIRQNGYFANAQDIRPLYPAPSERVAVNVASG